jgi:hypothetical protein
MSEYTLQDDLYLGITPSGSYYAIKEDTEDSSRTFLHRLMREPETPLFDMQVASEYSGLKKKNALEVVHWLQGAGLITGLEEPEAAPQKTLEELLPELLGLLSFEGKAILAESQGLYLGAAGFPHEAAEELAAMSANLTAVSGRHKSLLQGNLGYRQRGWGLIDASGNSEIGFWPLYIGGDRFTLIVAGMPQFNQPAFKEMVWALAIRYGNA